MPSLAAGRLVNFRTISSSRTSPAPVHTRLDTWQTSPRRADADGACRDDELRAAVLHVIIQEREQRYLSTRVECWLGLIHQIQALHCGSSLPGLAYCRTRLASGLCSALRHNTDPAAFVGEVRRGHCPAQKVFSFGSASMGPTRRSRSSPESRCSTHCANGSGLPVPRRVVTTASVAPARCSWTAGASSRV